MVQDIIIIIKLDYCYTKIIIKIKLGFNEVIHLWFCVW